MTIPNYITLIRVLLVPFFYTALTYYQPGKEYWRELALILFVIASATDALDGFIVRKWNLKSSFGTFFDPLADKILLISGFLGIHFSALAIQPPLWVIIIVIFRDIFIMTGLITVYVTTQAIKVEPNTLGKLTTFSQMLTIGLCLLATPLASISWHVTAALTVASGIVYILREMRRLHNGRW